MQDFIDLANHMADEAGTIITQYFRSSFTVDHKDDDTPVTIADRAVEQKLRAIVEEHRPEDGILGEEFGIKQGQNQYRWVFDPIDGTKSFVIGRPSFGTLIALCENDVPVLGVIDQPIMGERWVGAKGYPTTFKGHPVQTRYCTSLSEAKLACTSPSMMPDLWPTLYKKSDFVVWGGDCYSYGLIANGWLDGVVEAGLGTYDFAAIPPIVEGAGGLMCDWEGKPLTLSSGGNVIAIGDPGLKDELLDVLNV